MSIKETNAAEPLGTYAIVVTTINRPTRAVVEIAQDRKKLDATFYLIGDRKTPADFSQPGAEYLGLQAQAATGLAYAELAPVGHYARKNIGYLLAARAGAEVIVETDDDNIPLDGFWQTRERQVTGRAVTGTGWCNAYGYFSDSGIWPRGLPLNEVRRPLASIEPHLVESDCPIQQGLADGDPDVDAIYRLLFPLPINFDQGGPVVLPTGMWCPFNSQNTTFFREAFPLMYLPSRCSWRVTDIWRSFIAQRIGWENGWKLAFFGATVFQDRNEHDLMRDFAEEIPGYLHNERIKAILENISMDKGSQAIGANMIKSYEALVGAELVGRDELELLRAWLSDLGL